MIHLGKLTSDFEPRRDKTSLNLKPFRTLEGQGGVEGSPGEVSFSQKNLDEVSRVS